MTPLVLGGVAVEPSTDNAPPDAATMVRDARSSVAEERLQELRREVARHDELYHRKGEPEITDAAYDRLKEELLELEADLADGPFEPAAPSWIDDRASGTPSAGHHEPMLSLEKAYRPVQVEALYERWQRTLNGQPFTLVIEPKYDGVAVSVVYERGELVRALTRGNGQIGQDITAYVYELSDVPRRLQAVAGQRWPTLIELRGELYVERREFERLNTERAADGDEPFSHPRSAVVATLRQQDPTLVRERALRCVFFGIGGVEGVEAPPSTLEAWYEQMHQWGLPVVAVVRKVGDLESLQQALRQMEVRRSGYPFPDDGAVVKINERAAQAQLGATDDAPRWAFARKFSAVQARSTLRQVIWTVGRTGVLTPVAEFDPVPLGPTLVRRATLHHWQEVVERNLAVGDVLIIERAGDVIPVIVAVEREARARGVAPLSGPTHCPDCQELLQPRAVHLTCGNERCPGRLVRMVEHFTGPQGVRVAGLGAQRIRALVERGRLQSPADVFSLTSEELPPRVFASIQEARREPLAHVLQGLGVPGIGRSAARRLAAHYASIAAWFDADAGEWASVAGLGPAAVPDLRAYRAKATTQELVARLRLQGVGAAAAPPAPDGR